MVKNILTENFNSFGGTNLDYYALYLTGIAMKPKINKIPF